MTSRFVIATADGTPWWGFCPRWAAEPLPHGATLTRERVLVLGRPKRCTYSGCTDMHMDPGPKD